MNIREILEDREISNLSEFATKSRYSKGREISEPHQDIRTCFQRDRDRIIHSKAFRRLKHKTQVFLSPEGDHYRTRLTHTLEVSQIARTIARALFLNEDLVESIALGHDVGHTPFGHAGEYILDKIIGNFKHYDQSVRILKYLETTEKFNRYGLNLTYEVLDGIKNHSGNNIASTLEGNIIKFADRIAYINHDIDDAIRAGVLNKDKIPLDIRQKLGDSSSERISTLIMSIIKASFGQNNIKMEKDVNEAMEDLRSFMFKNVYNNQIVKAEDPKLYKLIKDIFDYYMDNIEKMPEHHLKIYSNPSNPVYNSPNKIIVADYIAGMTDKFLIDTYNDIFIPKGWKI